MEWCPTCKVPLKKQACTFKKWVEHRIGKDHRDALEADEVVADESSVFLTADEATPQHQPSGTTGFEDLSNECPPSPPPQPGTSSGASTLARVGGTAAGSFAPNFQSLLHSVSRHIQNVCENLQGKPPLPQPDPEIRKLVAGRKRLREPVPITCVSQHTRSKVSKTSQEAAAAATGEGEASAEEGEMAAEVGQVAAATATGEGEADAEEGELAAEVGQV